MDWHANEIETVARSGHKVQSVVSNGDGDWLVSACGPTSGICPDCRHQSRSRHGWSYRSLQDLPIQGSAVTVKLQLNRWRCTYRQCGRQTFTDRVPAIASLRPQDNVGRRNSRLARSQYRRAARRALDEALGISLSENTILRHLKRNTAGSTTTR
jgi:transposase